MKKLGVILSILVIFVLIGCASSGGGGGGAAASGNDAEPYSIDLSTLRNVRNQSPFTKQYDNLIILLPTIPVNLTGYQRVTIRAKYFNADGEEIEQGDGNAMVSLFYETGADIFSDGSSNVVIKEFNVGGYSGTVSTDRGVRMRLKQNPGGILLQNSDTIVKFIELTEVTFHN